MSDVADGSRDSIDQSVLTSLRELQDEGGPDIVAEVGGMFLKYSPQKIAAMKKAIEAGDAKALEVAAHGLKSSSSYIGAIKLSAISNELESMGRKGELEGALERAIQVQTEFERVKAALEVEIKKVGNIGLKKI